MTTANMTADESNNPDRQLAEMVEQTTIAWCFARGHNDRATLDQAARYVMAYHDFRGCGDIDATRRNIVARVREELGLHLCDDADERDARS